MKKSDELKKTYDGLIAKAEAFQSAEQYDDALKAVDDAKKVKHDLDAALYIEQAQAEDFAKEAEPTNAVAPVDESPKMKNRVFNKLVLGRQLDEMEQRIATKFFNAPGTPGQVGATPEKGGYLVPEEQMRTLHEYRRAYVALKDLCNVQTAASTSGKMPTIGTETGKLIEFEELNEIHQEDLDFGQIGYTIKDYGDIIPVSNQLLQDADIDLMSLIGQRFARKSINTENAEILTLLAALTPQSISNWKGISKAINVTLDPAISASAKIVTNQDGLQWLDELTDTMGRPLLTTSLVDPTKYVFRGKEITVVPNSLLASGTKTIPMYVGSFSDYLAFFQRLGVELAVSNEAGFTKYATLIRAVERFGVVADDKEAVISLNISTGA